MPSIAKPNPVPSPPTLINLQTHIDECKDYIAAGDTIIAANIHIAKDALLNDDGMVLRMEIQRKSDDAAQALMLSAVIVAQAQRLLQWRDHSIAPKAAAIAQEIQTLRDRGETDARIYESLRAEFPDDAAADGAIIEAIRASTLQPGV